MSTVHQAFPELYSESVEAKIFAVASRIYDSSEVGPPELYPQYTEPNGSAPHRYQYTPARFWTSGFFPGSIWLLYERIKTFGVTTGKVSPESWLGLAREWSEPLREQAARTDTHDLAFMFMPTFYKSFRHDKDRADDSKEVVLTSANSLASRYSPYTKSIRSWDGSGHLVNTFKRDEREKHFLVIIDNMMNLDLLYAAHYLSPDTTSTFPGIAAQHALTTIENHFHPEGGTYHVLNYSQSPNQPKILKRWAAQGYGDESIWSRGQAWAIHGFARSAEWTDIVGRAAGTEDAVTLGWGNMEALGDMTFKGEMRFVEQAKIAADYFISHLGEGKEAVPAWDFDAPNNPDGSLTFRDVSAGMIAVSGMLTLHSILRRLDPPQSSPYLAAAVKILRATLRYCSTPPAKFATGTTVDPGEDDWDTILNQSTINYNENAARRWADVGLVYADYYFLEVGNKLLEMERRGWITADEVKREA